MDYENHNCAFLKNNSTAETLTDEEQQASPYFTKEEESKKT